MDASYLKLVYITIIVIIFAYITLHIYRFYSRLAHYPRGPKPLPFVGNLHLLVANYNRHFGYLFKELAQNYGELYTVWLGSKPVVIINEIETAKKAFNQNECSDRFGHIFGRKVNELILPNHKTFILMNMCPEFKVLRKVSIEALRKFLSVDAAMSELTHKIVDNTVDLIKSRELGKPFAPFKYIDTIFIRVIYETIFNKPLDLDNHKIEVIIQQFESIQVNLIKSFVVEYIPGLHMFYKTAEIRALGKTYLKMFINGFNKFKVSSVSSDNYQSLIESHIVSANTMKSEGKVKAQYLNDSNIIGNLATLLGAGSDTSRYTFEWILIFMAYYPEMQQTMRDEVNTNIGNNIPDKCDREKCHFVNAFICETLRFRNIFALGGFHMTPSDIHIANTMIPKGTFIAINHISILNDKNYWQNPETFTPDRFLDSEQHFISGKIPAFVPFGTGKRMCIGDKFAMIVMFLVLVRLLQATHGMKFELQNRQESDLEPRRFGFFIEPKTIKLRLIKQN